MRCVFESFFGPLQAFLRTFEAYHQAGYQGFYGDHAPQRAAPRAVHPVIRTYPETGREALYVNRGLKKQIVGSNEKESRALLFILLAAVEEPMFQCRYHWGENDVAIWDNGCIQRHAIWDDYSETQSGVRVTICGDRPKLLWLIQLMVIKAILFLSMQIELGIVSSVNLRRFIGSRI
ncbi:MAG: taurine dioxygenase [Candidatus Azotimanducaceae bacterium]